MTDEETTEELEEYSLEEEELLRLKLMQSDVVNASLSLQLAKERLANFQQHLAGKYSEYGKYELLGEVDLNTRKGKRKLVTDG